MDSKKETNKPLQTFIYFDKPRLPNQELFPLNIKSQNRAEQNVVYPDIEASTEYIIVTGFTSLSNLIDLFGSRDFSNNRKVKVLIGFELERYS